MDQDADRLTELRRHAEKAISLWGLSAQLGQQPDFRHRDWWLGYWHAIKDVQSGDPPWPVEFGLPVECDTAPPADRPAG